MEQGGGVLKACDGSQGETITFWQQLFITLLLPPKRVFTIGITGPGYIAEPKIEFEDSVLEQLLPPFVVGVFSSSVRREWQRSWYLSLS